MSFVSIEHNRLILILYYFKLVGYIIECNDSKMTHQTLTQGRSTMTHLVKISDRTIVLLYIIEHVGITPDIVNLYINNIL